ncbi:MAG: replication protein C [Methanomicrobiaceae archaeon]|nr:replication protein C [Methanomicrobiaceae archaeon]MDD5419979.1 replication protein C [Methanomicrobiaceae archaeon]
MLWIEKYRPKRCEDILGQERVVRHLVESADTGRVPHLLLAGPHGSGKSAALECFARRLYGERWEENTSILSADALFTQGKAYLEGDERFAHVYRKDQSLIANFKYVVRWYASMRPLDADFKLIVFEGAEALTFEAQQALRRTMERYSATCRFVFITTNQSAIIPAIASRCLPLFFGPIPPGITLSRLRSILAAERPGAVADEDIELIAQAAEGDLRKGIMYLQIAAESEEPPDLTALSVSETAAVAGSVFAALCSGDLAAARRMTESLMIDYGLSGREVLAELRRVVRREYNDPALVRAIARTDHALGHAANEFVQINALLAAVIGEVFCEEGTGAL